MDFINSTEKTIVHQGLIASGKPTQIHTLPNESIQVVTILPFRTDGSIYKGDLTYTATKPVEITIGHKIPLNDSTLSKLETENTENYMCVIYLQMLKVTYLLHQRLSLTIDQVHHRITQILFIFWAVRLYFVQMSHL